MTTPKPSRPKRLAAFMFDELFATSVLALLGTIVPVAGSAVAVATYFIIQDSLCGVGCSPGRKLVGQRLAGESGESITHLRSVARNTVRLIVWMTLVGFVADLLVMAVSSRSIADYLTNTRVWNERDLDDARYLLEAHRDLDALS